ncbi:hypothetical protein Dimus_008625 [Dionaea muscipula]
MAHHGGGGGGGGGEISRQSMVSSAAGFCYPAAAADLSSGQTHLVSHLQSFDRNQEIYGLASSMDMIGFQAKSTLDHHHSQSTEPAAAHLWKGLILNKAGGGPSSSSKAAAAMNETSTGSDHFYQHDQFTNETSSGSHLMVAAAAAAAAAAEPAAAWQENSRLLVDESSLRCVFPCEGNERPSQGLSLSLSSNNPSTIGLQSFELRQTHHNQHQVDHLRFISSNTRAGGYVGKPSSSNFQQVIMQDDFMGKGENSGSSTSLQQGLQGLYQLGRSKYMGPTQELLNEFCNLGTNQTADHDHDLPQKLLQKNKQWELDDHDNNASSSSSSRHLQSLCGLDIMELQKRKESSLLCWKRN